MRRAALAALFAMLAFVAAPAVSASAATSSSTQTKIQKVLKEASYQKGKPYEYGADGPHAFDCSGLVRYVFLHSLNRSLPHNAAEQYDDSQHIARKNLRPGDLIFVDNGGSITHVGIYAGGSYWWVAPHSGTRVQKQRIYSAHFLFGRIIKG